jgi:hypothetical protein
METVPLSRSKKWLRILTVLSVVWLTTFGVMAWLKARTARQQHFRATFTMSVSPPTQLVFHGSYQRRLFKSFPGARLEPRPGTNLVDIVVRSQSAKEAEQQIYAVTLLFMKEFSKTHAGRLAPYGPQEAVIIIEPRALVRDEVRPRIDKFLNKLEAMVGK